MFFVRASLISDPVIFNPSIVIFDAGLKLNAIDATAPGSGITVTFPDFNAPRNVPYDPAANNTRSPVDAEPNTLANDDGVA